MAQTRKGAYVTKDQHDDLKAIQASKFGGQTIAWQINYAVSEYLINWHNSMVRALPEDEQGGCNCGIGETFDKRHPITCPLWSPF